MGSFLKEERHFAPIQIENVKNIIVSIYDEAERVGHFAANIVAEEIKQVTRNGRNQQLVLIFPTGSTPIPMYRKLVEMWRNGEINFEEVIFFNMDEYHGLEQTNPNSYHYFMHQHFYQFLWDKPGGVKPENVNLPQSGETREASTRNAKKYSEKLWRHLESSGSRVVLFGGIGRDPAHIAFNDFTVELDEIPETERNSYALNSKTRVVPLDLGTRKANMRFFDDKLELVPTHAITIGFKEILNCDRTVIMALDASKKPAVQSMLTSEPCYQVPASFLHLAKQQVELLMTRDVWP